MEIRLFFESDGKCFAKMVGGCGILGTNIDLDCGTYMCKWYKPEGCKDWARLDTRNMVRLYPPEDITYGRKKENQ